MLDEGLFDELRRQEEMYRDITRHTSMFREISEAVEAAKPHLSAVEAEIRRVNNDPVTQALRDLDRLRY